MVTPSSEQLAFPVIEPEEVVTPPDEVLIVPTEGARVDMSNPYRAIDARNQEIVERRGEDLRLEQTGVPTPGTAVVRPKFIHRPSGRSSAQHTQRPVETVETVDDSSTAESGRLDWAETQRIGRNGIAEARAILKAVKEKRESR